MPTLSIVNGYEPDAYTLKHNYSKHTSPLSLMSPLWYLSWLRQILAEEDYTQSTAYSWVVVISTVTILSSPLILTSLLCSYVMPSTFRRQGRKASKTHAKNFLTWIQSHFNRTYFKRTEFQKSFGPIVSAFSVTFQFFRKSTIDNLFCTNNLMPDPAIMET